ncbi:hypothetical protein ACNOYE_04525 [Nannocystaceae bacterium ST9]
MPYQVTRTDTGQFVLIDPATETVVIDDDLVAGFSKLDSILADKAKQPGAPALSPAPNAFAFRGGPRYTPMLLAIVLPFVWLLALYLALGNLLAQHSLTLDQAKDTQTEIDELERELQALRSEVSGAPRSAKAKPKAKPKPSELPPEDAEAEAPSEPPEPGAGKPEVKPEVGKPEVGKPEAGKPESKSPTGAAAK